MTTHEVAAGAVGSAEPVLSRLVRDEAVTLLFRGHHPRLVGLARLLVGDLATSEDVVQDGSRRCTGGGPPHLVTQWRCHMLKIRCALVRHRWLRLQTDDGERYEQCQRCGRIFVPIPPGANNVGGLGL